MDTVLVLMKAMPPTRGHKALIDFASLQGDLVTVLIDTKRDEPMIDERVAALKDIASKYPNVKVDHIYFDRSESDNYWRYWEEWRRALKPYAGTTFVVGSEQYCKRIARLVGAQFLPYDINRTISSVKAIDIRTVPWLNFDKIAPEFQHYMRTVVTIFGAESTGKTTLAKRLSDSMLCPWYFEWARPFLEETGNDITKASMNNIACGQAGLQTQARRHENYSLIIQDTDLYSTIGYWELPHWAQTLGTPPRSLINMARVLKSDLYVICRSNIPFEEDPLRYGGSKRESSDEYWIGVCEKYNLPYVVVDSDDLAHRAQEAYEHISAVRKERLGRIAYERETT